MKGRLPEVYVAKDHFLNMGNENKMLDFLVNCGF